jgi:hypothetical protein
MKKVHKVVGEFKGKPGDYVLRKRGNKLIICSRTRRILTESAAQAVAKRKFGIVTRISAAINRNKYLKILWSKTGGYNKIVKENYARFVPSKPYDFPIMIPGCGFHIAEDNINISNGVVKIDVKLSGPFIRINPEVEKRMTVTGVLILSDPQDERDREFMVIELQAGSQKIKLEEQVNIVIELYGDNRACFSYYKKARVFLTVVTLNDDSVPVQYSNILRGEN